MEKITGKSTPAVLLDLGEKAALSDLFQKNKFCAVLHLAAFKCVGESVEKPLEYYRNNVCGTLNLLEVGYRFDSSCDQKYQSNDFCRISVHERAQCEKLGVFE